MANEAAANQADGGTTSDGSHAVVGGVRIRVVEGGGEMAARVAARSARDDDECDDGATDDSDRDEDDRDEVATIGGESMGGESMGGESISHPWDDDDIIGRPPGG